MLCAVPSRFVCIYATRALAMRPTVCYRRRFTVGGIDHGSATGGPMAAGAAKHSSAIRRPSQQYIIHRCHLYGFRFLYLTGPSLRRLLQVMRSLPKASKREPLGIVEADFLQARIQAIRISQPAVSKAVTGVFKMQENFQAAGALSRTAVMFV